MKISVLGSGAFGTALAISLSTGDKPKTGHCVITGPRKQRPFAELSISNVVMCHVGFGIGL
jgi:glycerol-3-phosphate dehydrogenase